MIILNMIRNDLSLTDAIDYIEQTCSAVYKLADSFRYGRRISQIRKISSKNISTGCFHTHSYEEKPEVVHAVDDELTDKTGRLIRSTKMKWRYDIDKGTSERKKNVQINLTL